MTQYQVIVVRLEDLSEVTVVCGNCGTSTTTIASKSPALDRCPSCKEDFGDFANNALVDFSKFYQRAKDSKSRIEFHIKTPLDKQQPIP